MNYTPIVSALLVLLIGAAAVSAGGPAKDIPQLKALGHYVGSWDITIKGSPYSKGKATAKWILGGRFVQQTGKLQSKDGSKVLEMTTLMTYDPKKKSFRMVTFLSDGFIGEATGTWNPKTKTMTSIGRNNGFTTTTTANFAKKGIEEWRIVTTDASGNVVGEMRGTSTRRRE